MLSAIVLKSPILSSFPQGAFSPEAAQSDAVVAEAEWLAGLPAQGALEVEAPVELRAAVAAAPVVLRAEPAVLVVALEAAASQPAGWPAASVAARSAALLACSVAAAQRGPVLSAELMDG